MANNKLLLGFTLLLAGCGGAGGYEDAPRIGNPSDAMIDEAPRQMPARQNVDREYPPEQDIAAPGDYPPSDYRSPEPQRRPSAALPVDLPSTGPRGTSGEQRYDAVGYASWYGEEMGGGRTASGQAFDPGAVAAAHNSLPLGSFVEITALDSGRTIVAIVNDRGPGAGDRLIDLSRGAAQQLGLTGVAPVRVRLVNPPPPDQMALRSGRPAATRIDAPQTLLTALRRKLPTRGGANRPVPTRSVTGAGYAPPGAPRGSAQPARAGLYVQVAALSNAARAEALAEQLGGRVERAGSIYRVQIGPFANANTAQRARDDVARRGYGDARIVQTN